MKIPSPVSPLRPSTPRLIAGLCCAAIVVLAVSADIRAPKWAQQPPERDAEPTRQLTTTQHSAVPARSIGELIVSALALVPASLDHSTRLRAGFVQDNEDTTLVAAVIENHEDARPHQQGLKDAIAVFELIVEGDISRFLAFFRGDRLPARIGPIRSLRTHFVDIALGYRPLLLHAGGHRLAYEVLERHPELPHHDGIRYDGETYERDRDVAPPHNLFMPREALLQLLKKMTLQEIPLPLFGNASTELSTGQELGIKNPGTTEGAGRRQKSETVRRIEVSFGSPVHDATFTYNPFSGVYNRSTGSAPAQAKPVNIVILEARIEGFGDRSAIPWTQTFGGGGLLLFSRGTMREGRWAREKEEPFSFLDAEGKPLRFAKGQTWVMMLPGFEKVEWE